MTFSEIEAIIKSDGWYFCSAVGSHYQYKHATKKGKVTIPWHTRPKDLPSKTISSILKQAQIKKVGDKYVDAVSGDIL